MIVNNFHAIRAQITPFEAHSVLIVDPYAVPACSRIDGIRTEVVIRAAQLAFSDTGTLVYAPGGAVDESRLVVVDRNGVATPLPFDPDYFGQFSLSPDGTKLAALIIGVNTELWIYDLDRGRRRRVGNLQYCPPIWSPDSARLYYCEEPGADGSWRWVSAQMDGGQITSHFETADPLYDISPDERTVFGDNAGRIIRQSLDSPETVEIVFESSARAWGPMYSPDGRFLSFTSNEIGQSDIIVMALDGSGREWKVSVDGGEEALWSQDGTELFYSNGTRWYRVPVSTEPDFTFGKAELLFEGPYLNVPGYGYAVFPDAERFVLVESVADVRPIGELRVVENWFEELRRLAPVE